MMTIATTTAPIHSFPTSNTTHDPSPNCHSATTTTNLPKVTAKECFGPTATMKYNMFLPSGAPLLQPTFWDDTAIAASGS